ncbi:MAG: thiamine-phosphate kinase [Pseudomonadota bacterium]
MDKPERPGPDPIPKAGAPAAWADERHMIADLFAPLAKGLPGAFNLTEDAACLMPPAGQSLVVSTDAVVAGVHLPEDADAFDVAWKSLAVNVSDIVAKGATPNAYLMSLMVPHPLASVWMERFVVGLREAQDHFGVALCGGDTDCPKSVSVPRFKVGITIFGHMHADHFVRRSTAQLGDRILVTGLIGNATLGLRLETEKAKCAKWPPLPPADIEQALAAYRRPAPNVAICSAVRSYATASIDISDGLIKDVERLCHEFGHGADLTSTSVPIGAAARTLVEAGDITLQDLMTGGEDYCLAVTIPPQSVSAFQSAMHDAGALAVEIGTVVGEDDGLVVRNTDGQPMTIKSTGWDYIG